MKSKILVCIPLVLCFLLAACASAWAQGTAFTYQGRLNTSTNPANGNYDLQFTLYGDTNTLSPPVAGPITNSAVGVTNGLFTSTLDLGPFAFATGSPRYLEIAVRTNGGAAFTTLAPRQPVTPSPYAMFAGTASNANAAALANAVLPNSITAFNLQNATITAAKIAAGQVVKSLNGLTDNVTLSAGTNVILTTNANGLQISSSGGAGGSSTNFVNKTGDTMSGNLNLAPSANLNFGSQTRQMMTLFNTAPYIYGIGVQNSTLYQRAGASGGFAWYQGGAHSDTQNDPGPNGVILMTLDAYGDLNVPGQITASNGVVGRGNGLPFSTGVSGLDSSGSPNSSGVSGTSTGGKGVYGYSGQASSLSAGVWGENPVAGGTAIVGKAVGVGSTGIYATGVGNAGFFQGNVTVTSNGFFQGNVTVTSNEFFGFATRQMLNLYDTTYGIGVQDYTLYQRTAATGGFAWYAGGVHNDNQNNPGGGATLMTLDGSGNLYAAANANVCTLTIRGGCDLAEPFQMSANDTPKGSVVVIDDAAPGKLKLSDRPYDQRVAGIVSGANGINSGIALHQEGMLEGGQNVALSGRVYVLADATNDSIKPGDLLTTSPTPGHAMKVTDHARAQGAILGKAMSGLEDGKGMVLVLVTLQ